MAYQVGSVVQQSILTPGEHTANVQQEQAKALTLQAAVEQRRAQADQLRAEQAEKAYLTDAYQRLGGDEDAIIAEAKQRDPDLGLRLQDRVTKGRTALLDGRKKALDVEKLEAEIDLDMLGRMTDEGSFQIYRPRLSKDLQQVLGEQFDPAKRDALLQRAPDEMKRLQQLKEFLGKSPREAMIFDLAGADTPEEWAGVFAGYQRLGVKPNEIAAVQDVVGKDFTPEGFAKVREMIAKPEAQRGGTSDYAQFLERWAAEKHKTTPDKLTATQEIAARKAYGQADDAARRPLAPVIVMTSQGPMVTTGADRQNVAPVIGPDGKPIAQAPTTAQRDRVDSAKRASQFLDLAQNLSTRINTDKGLAAKLTGTWRQLLAKANEDDDVAEYVSLVELFTPLLARAAGHTGVLTEPDYLHTIQALPKPGDSATLARRKMQNLRTLVGGGDGTDPATSTAPKNQNVSEAVRNTLAQKAGGKEYDLSDGNTYHKDAAGNITLVGKTVKK